MTFGKGESGNPNGRPKGIADRLAALGCDSIEGMARDLCPVRVAKLIERFPVRLTQGRSRDEEEAVHGSADYWDA
jgi:hypothetical protein